jgi:hypothetical protein
MFEVEEKPEKPVSKVRSAIFWKITQLMGPIGCPET